eukprot:GHVS01043956.1.p2 GENE.GHVS01043956.1~~GHVS01043956.1.p2  ORF type:complete len:102 (-),score=12.80 GHVS01043956.1:109-414(-)
MLLYSNHPRTTNSYTALTRGTLLLSVLVGLVTSRKLAPPGVPGVVSAGFGFLVCCCLLVLLPIHTSNTQWFLDFLSHRFLFPLAKVTVDGTKGLLLQEYTD